MIQSAMMVTGFTPSTTPPDGPPVSPTLYSYGGGLVGISWASGDTEAETEIAYVADPTRSIPPSLPSEIVDKVAPGVTGWESGSAGEVCTFYVRHKRGGSTTAWVIAAIGPFECTELF